ncbi:MAG: SDR family NAD(P)-dependent oxidoreductase [Gemmatimonadaceae bacterium]
MKANSDGPDYLRGRHAVVTGGGRGIGAAVSSALAALGAAVTVMGRDEHALAHQAERLRAEFGGAVAAIRCDVADGVSVAAAFSQARERHGDPFVLVNNAGQAAGGAFAEMDRAVWDTMLAVNLTGTYLCAREVVPAMTAARAGRIINVASTAGLKGYNKMAAYCASKHGVVGLTRALAMETAKLGVTVNAVCPGYTDTGMARSAVDTLVEALGKTREEAMQMLVRVIPRGSLIQPGEVASAVAWLCAPEASGVTGQALAVAGGEVQ